MSIILAISDFSGFHILNQSTARTPILQAMIDRYEAHYIKQLLGAELGNLFIANKAEPSQDARFVVIQDAFDYTHNQKDYSSRGMKDYLLAAVLYEYVTNMQVRPTDNGIAKSVDEAETIVTPQQARRYAERKWNEALDTVEAIQWYCKTYADTLHPSDPDMQYPEYLGKELEPIFSPLI